MERFFMGSICTFGHEPKRYVKNGRCVECQRLYNAARSPEKKAAALESAKRWQKEHPEAHKANFARWRAANQDHDRARCLEWQKDNRGKVNAALAKRKAALRQRTPAWADSAEIAAFYETAARLTKETGVPHEVDHIVPILGRNVSGLHVQFNLQVLTKSENLKKSNRHAD